MFYVCCHDKYTSKATVLSASSDLELVKESALKFRRVYRHITVSDDTGKIYMQRKDRDCCKLEKVEHV